MTDLRPTIAPKSDQINADDLIGSTRTIRVTKVSLCKEAEQPIAINFEGDNGKPYKPCKSMRRVLVTVWGPDGAAYAGRAMTLYRDDSVKFGGLDVGGIRISHMSDIKAPVTMALTATRAQRKPFTVKPLIDAPPPSPPAMNETPKRRTYKMWLDDFTSALEGAATIEQVNDLVATKEALHFAANGSEAQKKALNDVIEAAKGRIGLIPPPLANEVDDGWPGNDDGWSGPEAPAAAAG